MGLLDSRTVVITGGSMGIGFAAARKCVEEGALVVIAARNPDSLKKALAELNAMSDRRHFSYSLDVSGLNEAHAFAKWCSSELDGVNGLVNCAGVYGPIGKTSDVDMDEFTKAININLLGTVYMSHAFLPLLESNDHKKIVNFSGGGAASPFPRYSAYATSKAAIVRFTENLSLELADDKVDVNCIAPGFVVTRLHQQTVNAGSDAASKDFFEKTKEQITDGGVPPEIAADLTAFLLSKEADGITGKFLAAPYDPWQEKAFQDRLRTEKDLATLRRIDEKFFNKM